VGGSGCASKANIRSLSREAGGIVTMKFTNRQDPIGPFRQDDDARKILLSRNCKEIKEQDALKSVSGESLNMNSKKICGGLDSVR
jgi:hypothetical protein